jgi:LMBR1 domain-containing protein 1
MIDVLTIIMMIIVGIILLIANFYILIYFSHPDDRSSCSGWFLKILVLIGLTLAWFQVLLLPLDVNNIRTFGSGLNMKVLWYILFISIMVYVLILFPISSSYYETDEDWSCCEKITHSLSWFLVYIIFFGGLSLVLYFTIGKAEIPINSITCNYNDFIITPSNIDISKLNNITKICNISEDKFLEIKVSFIVYAIAILSFVSWIVFSFFGGIGLAAVPLDFFYDFCTRPKSMIGTNLKKRKKILFRELEELKLLGNELTEMEQRGANHRCFIFGERRRYDNKKHEYVARYALAEEEFHIVNASIESKLKNNCVVLCYYCLIPFGVISSIFTVLWLIQFCCSYFYIKNGRPGYPFLSYLLIFFQDESVSFLSFFIFALLCLYLLFCLIKGNFKFGVRILCCWSIHPMKKDKTYMNSFIFNVSLILLGSCAITQFCTDCLYDYVSFTDIDSMFNVMIKNLKFFYIFYKYHIFQYVFFGVFVLSFVYLIIRPTDRRKPIYSKHKNRMDPKEMRLLK